MAEKGLQGDAPEPNPKQPQNQGLQGEKDAQPIPPQEQTTRAKNPSQKPILQGRAPTPEEQEQISASAEYWHRVRDESVVKEIDKSEEAAKQLIGLTSALQALYIAIYAFSDFRQQLGALSISVPLKLILSLLYFLPLLVWLLCLYYAARFFVGIKVRSGINLHDISPSAWMQLRDTYELANREKMRMLYSLRRSLELMIVSTGIALLLLGFFIFLAPVPPPAPTQIIIVTPTPVLAT